ncbi:hypothetical protein N7501_009168 [Penicillium viridicatum]|nr:hypothetical protein N7501_009168 [Penicillium viridicatum]
MGAMRYADGTELSLGTQGTDRIVPPGKQQGSSGPDEAGDNPLPLSTFSLCILFAYLLVPVEAVDACNCVLAELASEFRLHKACGAHLWVLVPFMGGKELLCSEPFATDATC